jgi:hypothetical protein
MTVARESKRSETNFIPFEWVQQSFVRNNVSACFIILYTITPDDGLDLSRNILWYTCLIKHAECCERRIVVLIQCYMRNRMHSPNIKFIPFIYFEFNYVYFRKFSLDFFFCLVSSKTFLASTT